MTSTPDDALEPPILRALHEALPHADARRATIAGRGWDVVAWRIPAPDGDWLLRVPRLADAHATIDAQHRLMDALRETGLPLPREPRLLRDKDGQFLAGLYRYVDGEIAQPVGRAARARLATSIAEFLSTLHAVDPAIGVRCGATPSMPWPEVWEPMIERCAGAFGAATEVWIRATGERLERASRSMPPLTLIHADLKPAHVLVNAECQILGVLDFEGVQVSDPAFDFSRVSQNWDAPLAAMALKQYRGAVDEGFEVRVQCYRDFDWLSTFDVATQRGWSEWFPLARRGLGARAAAARRRVT